MKDSVKLELYIHIPFCVKKCNYCDFLSGPDFMEKQEAYFEKLIKEIKDTALKVKNHPFYRYEVSSIFIGGGTPSLLSKLQIKELMETLTKNFRIMDDCEITMEVNPESLTLLKAKAMKAAGINRVSIGLQSTDDDELKSLGRIHDVQTFKDALFFLKISGFTNINIDIMYGIPGQSIESFEKTVRDVVSFNPAHVSAYSLIIEEGTPFDEMKEELSKSLPDEDSLLEMEKLLKKILTENGYNRYEVSNYAKENMESRHNLGYWSMTEYIGMGLGASSYYNGKRYKNTTDIDEYINLKLSQAVTVERDKDLKKDREEFIFLGLRKLKGISKEDYKTRYGRDIYEDYGTVLDKHIGLGYLIDSKGYIHLTDRGMDISNAVLSDFL